jgi:hypothetical protein
MIALHVPWFKCILLLPWGSTDMKQGKYLNNQVPWDTMCTPCLTKAKRLHEIYKKYTWDNLPGLFDLPSWDSMTEKSGANSQ